MSSVMSFPGILAHSVEDFLHGVPAQFGLSTTAGAWLFGVVVATQVAALTVAAATRRRLAAGVVAAYGFGWVIAALADHPDVVLPGAFREGPSSRVWVAIIVVGQFIAGVAATVYAARSGSRRRSGRDHHG